MQSLPGTAADVGEVAAPLCEVGALGYVTRRFGLDLGTMVIAADWSATLVRRMLSRLPQPFTDRTDAAFSVQGKGWRTVSEQLHGIRFTDRRCARADYLDALTEGGDAGGVLLTLDDYYLPWLEYSGASHGLLPHVVAVDGDGPGPDELRLVEGHTWWAGAYSMSRDAILSAAFPEHDVHDIAGWQTLVERAGEQARPDQVADWLVRSCAEYLSADESAEITPAGTFHTHQGPAAIDRLRAEVENFGYVCELTDSAELRRDVEFGRYLFQRITDELAFACYARQASARLLAGLPRRCPASLAGAVRRLADESWGDAWGAARTLVSSLDRGDLGRLAEALKRLAELDGELAARISGI